MNRQSAHHLRYVRDCGDLLDNFPEHVEDESRENLLRRAAVGLLNAADGFRKASVRDDRRSDRANLEAARECALIRAQRLLDLADELRRSGRIEGP